MGAIANDAVTGNELGMGLPHLPGIKELLQQRYGDRGQLRYDARD